MLERLKIDRFKSIRSADIRFGRVNLFIGANGSGKSNILEAIGITSAMLGKGIGNPDLSRKGVRLTPPELMKSAHKNRDLPKTLELSAYFTGGIEYKCNLSSSVNDSTLRVHSESASIGGVRQFGRSARGNKVGSSSLAGALEKSRGIWDQVKAAFSFSEVITETFQEFSRFAIYSPQTDFLRGTKFAKADEPPVGLHGEGLPDAVLGLLRQSYKYRQNATEGTRSEASIARQALDLVYLPGWTRGVRVGNLEKHMISADIRSDSESMVYFIDRFMRDERNKLSAYDSSEGTLFLLFAAVLLAHRDAPKYFALDNVDSALNPTMTRTLVENIISITEKSSGQDLAMGPRQVFLTSHNPTSLDAFDLFNENQRAFIVSRDKETGDTLLTRLKPRDGMSRTDWSIATNGKKLSQLWLDGSIAGLGPRDEL